MNCLKMNLFMGLISAVFVKTKLNNSLRVQVRELECLLVIIVLRNGFN